MFKNWKTICQIPDTHFMWALALLNLATDFGRLVCERFPEYFTQEEPKEVGPIPLSLLRQVAAANASKDWGTDYRDCLVTDHACEQFNIPVRVFGDRDEEPSRAPWSPEFDQIRQCGKDQSIGQIIELQGGKKVVVVENFLPEGLTVAPAECIAVDC